MNAHTAVLNAGHTGPNLADPGKLTFKSEHDQGANKIDSSGIQIPAQDPTTHGPYTVFGLISGSHTPMFIRSLG